MSTQHSGRIFVLGVASLSILCTAAFPVAAQYGGGEGTPEEPYRIFTAAQLNAVGTRPQDWDKHFRLMADIDLGAYRAAEFNRIGTSEGGAFTGTFDGNYRTLSGFHWSSPWRFYVGLFGLVDGEQARIANVTLVDPDVAVEGGRYVAALVGLLRTGTLANCHVRGGAVLGDSCVGAMVGQATVGTLTDCTVATTVHGVARVGGLIGYARWGTVARSAAAGAVLGSWDDSAWAVGGLIGEAENVVVTACRAHCLVEGNRHVGGLVGHDLTSRIASCYAEGFVRGRRAIGGLVGQNSGGRIADSYALTDVAGDDSVGGLVGYNAPSCACVINVPGVIERCYAAGSVKARLVCGGLVAGNERSDVTRSFWDVEAAGCTASAGGEAKTTWQMQTPAAYLDAGWDFAGEAENGTEDIWYLPAGSYPQLSGQVLAGDLDADGDVDLRDYSIFAGQWRQMDTAFWSGGTWMATDGVVDLDDLTLLTNAWLAGRP